MKILFILMLGIFALLKVDAWCQPPLPSGPGDTLKRSQDTREYYQLERQMQKDRQRLKEKTDGSEEKSGNQEEFEINQDENHVIIYSDQEKPENE